MTEQKAILNKIRKHYIEDLSIRLTAEENEIIYNYICDLEMINKLHEHEAKTLFDDIYELDRYIEYLQLEIKTLRDDKATRNAKD